MVEIVRDAIVADSSGPHDLVHAFLSQPESGLATDKTGGKDHPGTLDANQLLGETLAPGGTGFFVGSV